jgi:hypothetical protein
MLRGRRLQARAIGVAVRRGFAKCGICWAVAVAVPVRHGTRGCHRHV